MSREAIGAGEIDIDGKIDRCDCRLSAKHVDLLESNEAGSLVVVDPVDLLTDDAWRTPMIVSHKSDGVEIELLVARLGDTSMGRTSCCVDVQRHYHQLVIDRRHQSERSRRNNSQSCSRRSARTCPIDSPLSLLQHGSVAGIHDDKT